MIAEKPSVAQSIAKVIGATTKHDGYLEGSGYLVSWCVGHLVELMERDDVDCTTNACDAGSVMTPTLALAVEEVLLIIIIAEVCGAI